MSVGGGDDWDDIEAEGLAARAANAGAPKLGGPASPSPLGGGDASSAYGGGGLSSMDDDPFADDVPGGALELDLPSHHQAQSPRSVPVSKPPVSKAPPSMQPERSIPAPAPPSMSSAPPGTQGTQSLQPGPTSSFRPQEASIPPQSGSRSIQPRYPSTSADRRRSSHAFRALRRSSTRRRSTRSTSSSGSTSSARISSRCGSADRPTCRSTSAPSTPTTRARSVSGSCSPARSSRSRRSCSSCP